MVRKIAIGDVSAREVRLFFSTFASLAFNIAAQAARSTAFSNLFSVTYGGVLNTHVPDGSLILELEIPVTELLADKTMRNSMENELFTDRIESSWVIGKLSTDDEVTRMLKRRSNLPVGKYLQDVDMDDNQAVNTALHLSKGNLIDSLLKDDLIPDRQRL